MKNNIIETAMNKKGQFTHMEWARPCKTLKSCTSEIEKKTVAYNVRIGCGYDNLKTTIEGRENGTLPSENQGLKGFEWAAYPVHLKSLKTGKDYIRIETAKNTKFETVYFMNGKQVEKREIESYLQASEKKNGEMPTVMNIAVDSIQEIK